MQFHLGLLKVREVDVAIRNTPFCPVGYSKIDYPTTHLGKRLVLQVARMQPHIDVTWRAQLRLGIKRSQTLTLEYGIVISLLRQVAGHLYTLGIELLVALLDLPGHGIPFQQQILRRQLLFGQAVDATIEYTDQCLLTG